MPVFIWLVLLAQLAVNHRLYGQQQVLPTHELSIGDTLPAHLVPGRGPLILNFWATWCGPCVAELPLFDSVAAETGTLRVLCVSYERDSVVQAFFAKHPEIPHGHISIQTDDRKLLSYFPHQALPHTVWLDKEMVVRAITGCEAATRDNLLSFARGQLPNMATKKDVIFDYRKPLHIADSALYFRSIFNPAIPGVNLGGIKLSHNGLGVPAMRDCLGFGLARTDLIWTAYTGLRAVNNYLLEVRSTDSLRFFWPEEVPDLFKKSRYRDREEWRMANTFFYNLQFPQPVSDSVFFSFMQRDLEFNLNLRAHFESRQKRVRVVQLDKPIKSAIVVANPADSMHIWQTGPIIHYRRVPLSYILRFVTGATFGKRKEGSYDEPYVNETGLDLITGDLDLTEMGNSDVSLLTNVYDWEKCLAKQWGLRFSFDIQPYPVLVVEDLTD